MNTNTANVCCFAGSIDAWSLKSSKVFYVIIVKYDADLCFAVFHECCVVIMEKEAALSSKIDKFASLRHFSSYLNQIQ
jgi:hypothetical protein